MLRSIPPQWTWAFDILEGDIKDCEHEFDDTVPELNETEYGGTLVCVHCGALMTYDVSDIGD
jgi:hypothetical protein